MSVRKTACAVTEFPVPEREYRVAPPSRWDGGIRDRNGYAVSRRGRKRRRSLLFLLLGLVLFACGFRLGRAASAQEPPAASAGTSAPVSVLSTGGGRTDGVMPEGSGNGPAAPGNWKLILVNWETPLSRDFTVPELTELVNGHAIDSRAYPALQRMMDGARAAGLQPTICSSYRTWDKQEELFDNKVQRLLAEGYSRQEAEEQAAMWVARPGTSEHQAGLAVDIVDKSYQLLDRGQEDTAVQKWLMTHCAEYGFILRYPTGKSGLTGVNYEPWHYRYVGTEAAAEIMERGICLEEYLAELTE